MIRFLLPIAVALTATASTAQNLTGRAQVTDVDTIRVQGYAVRLNGVDGPELGTRAGQDAKRWMAGYLRGKTVECYLNGDKTYNRWVGVCYVDGTDIGAAAIQAGHALDCRRYSGGRYRHLETAAAKSRLKRAGYCR